MHQITGAGLAILGAALASFKLHDLMKLKLRNVMKGVKYGVIAMIGWGISFNLIGILAAELSWFLPIFLIKIATALYLLAYSGATRQRISFPKNVALFIILIGILEFAAFLSYGIGVNSEKSAIIAPIASAFPMVTIILARIFLKESLEINQKLGVISVLAGLVLLSI